MKAPRIVLLCAAFFIFQNNVSAEEICSNGIVISEIYGDGGNSGALYGHDFIELFNPTKKEIDISGWSIQYLPSTRLLSSSHVCSSLTPCIMLDGKIAPGTYYLIEGSGKDQLEWPIAGVIADMQSSINIAATGGQIALVASKNPIMGNDDPKVVDFVGFGISINESEKSKKCLGTCALKPKTHEGISRKSGSKCMFQNSRINGEDFDSLKPNPHNSKFVNENKKDEEDENNENKVSTCLSYLIMLNEIHPFNEEFVEIVNIGEKECILSDWRIEDNNRHKKSFEQNAVIEPGEMYVLKGNLSLNDDGDTVYLFDGKGNIAESVPYGKGEKLSSFSRFAGGWKWTGKITMGQENKFPEKKIYAHSVSINEVYPYPQKGSDEYIELYNNNSIGMSLAGWTLRDASKNGKYVFSEDSIIKGKSFLVVYGIEYKFALNNSKSESVYLIDPNNEIVANITFSGIKKGASYSYDESGWRWSSFITPGIKNKMNHAPEAMVSKEDIAYVNVPKEFSVKVRDKDKEKTKVVWDFGDGHKSYMKKTKHKFKKKGKYTVTVKVSDKSEDVLKKFTIEVKKYPRQDIEIIEINPNPKGKDSGMETITIKNNSKKSAELKGWSIATGSDKLINHPIKTNEILLSGETIVIGHDDSKFALGNGKGKLELRYPDGKKADGISYVVEKDISEGSLYRKTENLWKWVVPDNQKKEEKVLNDEKDFEKSIIQTEENTREIKEKILNSILLKNEFEKNLAERTESAKIYERNGKYYFTIEQVNEKHYAEVFLKDMAREINKKLHNAAKLIP